MNREARASPDVMITSAAPVVGFILFLLLVLSEANHLEACNFPYTFETMLRIIPDQ